MADKLKKDAKGFEAKTAALKKGVAEVSRYKEKAAEQTGNAGQATKRVCDDNNLNKWAFTQLCGTSKKDVTEQQDRILTMMAGAIALGMLDQVDMFDDRLKVIHEKIGAILDGSAPAAPAKGAANVANLASVN